MFTESHVFSRIRDNIHETVTKCTHIRDVLKFIELKRNKIYYYLKKVIFLNSFQKTALYYITKNVEKAHKTQDNEKNEIERNGE